MTPTPPDPDRLLHNLLDACGRFSVDAVAAIGPCLADRLLGADHFVTVSLTPARARLVVQASGQTLCVHEASGVQFPPALGLACAAVVEAALARVSDEARRMIAGIVNSGTTGGLGLIVERDTGTCTITLDPGDLDPCVVAVLHPGPEIRH